MLQADTSNMMLQALSPRLFATLGPMLSPIDLPQRYKISRPGAAATRIVFPSSGVVSVIADTKGLPQELGLFGREGVSGLSVFLSPVPSRNLVVVQVAGKGVEIAASALKNLFDKDEEFRELILAYLASFIVQLSHTAVCNVQCNVSQRLARWLMMIQDRTETKSFAITHDYVSAMLGVSRTSVTISLNILAKEGYISTGRKMIKIENRSELSKLAGHHYGGPEAEYSKLMAARVHHYAHPHRSIERDEHH